LRRLRNLNFHLGEALQDCPSGVDDLIEAKVVYLKAMELSTLIAKTKATIAEPDQGVFQVVGASAVSAVIKPDCDLSEGASYGDFATEMAPIDDESAAGGGKDGTPWRVRNDLRDEEAVAREGLLRVAAEDAAGRFLNLGITLHKRGDYPSAEVAFRKAIFATPENPDLYLYLGEMLEEKREWSKAVAVYQDASKVAPDFAEAFNTYFGWELHARYPSTFLSWLIPSSP
jgi:tetratricopeptide (TPR) repeat protein